MSGCGHFAYTDGTPGIRQLGFGIPALEYASMGYRVLPLARGAKSPHKMTGERGGVHHSTLDPAQIRTWWSMDPWANIGIATGSASSLAVIDLDIKQANGFTSLGVFLSSYGLAIPGTHPVALTPSGGMHIWLRLPAGQHLPDRPGILAGVDLKGDGGYVLAHPSVLEIWPEARPGQPRPSSGAHIGYRWERGCPCGVPMAPQWLTQWAAWRPAGSGGASSPGQVTDLDELKRSGAEPGQRNTTFYVLACRLYRVLGDHEQVMAELRAVYDATDTSGFPWSEVELAAWSARQFITSENERWDRELGETYNRWGRWTPS